MMIDRAFMQETYRFARCKKPWPSAMMWRMGTPLPADAVEAVQAPLPWESFQVGVLACRHACWPKINRLHKPSGPHEQVARDFVLVCVRAITWLSKPPAFTGNDSDLLTFRSPIVPQSMIPPVTCPSQMITLDASGVYAVEPSRLVPERQAANAAQNALCANTCTPAIRQPRCHWHGN